jgi:hypothetical protein
MGGLPPNALWSRSISGALDEAVSAVAVAPDGTVAVVGFFAGSVTVDGITLTSAGGGRDFFLVRYAADGAVLDAHRWGSDLGDEAGGAVAFDGAGNTLFAGRCAGAPIDFGAGPEVCPADAGFLMAIGPDGDVVWRHGPQGYGAPVSVAVAANGDLVVLGACESDCDLGGGALAGNGTPDITLARYDGSGDHLWSKRFDDLNEMQRPGQVAIGPQGTLHVAGFFGPGDMDPTLDLGGGPLLAQGDSPVDYDGFVAAFDATGAHLWSRAVGGADESSLVPVVPTADGGVVVGGKFDGTIDAGSGPLTAVGEDVLVARYDAEGEPVWTRVFAAPAGASLFGVAAGPAGSVHTVGVFEGNLDVDGGPLVSAGATDAFVVSLDADGNHLASRRFGDGCIQYGTAIAAAPAGMVVGGVFRGPGAAVDLGNGPLVAVDLYDSFVGLLPLP